jgi:hypothetical protein
MKIYGWETSATKAIMMLQEVIEKQDERIKELEDKEYDYFNWLRKNLYLKESHELISIKEKRIKELETQLKIEKEKNDLNERWKDLGDLIESVKRSR